MGMVGLCWHDSHSLSPPKKLTGVGFYVYLSGVIVELHLNWVEINVQKNKKRRRIPLVYLLP